MCIWFKLDIKLDGVVFYVPVNTIGYTGDGFYRSKDPTNSVKVLKGHIQYINNRKIH